MLPTIPDDRSYLGVRQLEDLEKQRSSLIRQIENPTIEDKGALRRRIVDINRAIAEDSPPALTGADFDLAVKEEKRMRAEISKGMLSREEMMRAPRGATEIEVKYQEKNARRILRWKNLVSICNPGDASDDLRDVDRLRPARSSLPMTEAQIPRGKDFLFMRDLPGEKYDDTFGPSPEGETLGERLDRLEAAAHETRAKIAEQGGAPKSTQSPGPRGPGVAAQA